jgi:hypothetical protein
VAKPKNGNHLIPHPWDKYGSPPVAGIRYDPPISRVTRLVRQPDGTIVERTKWPWDPA